MNRTEALTAIGKKVIVNEGKEGKYIGTLKEVLTPPRKVWQGVVTIEAVSILPEAIINEHNEPFLKYKENEVIECIGTKIELFDEEVTLGFNQSIIEAAEKRWTEMQHRLTHLYNSQQLLNEFLSKLGIHHSVQNRVDQSVDSDFFITYTFQKTKGKYFLVDERNGRLELENCPFEFHWYDERPYVGHYESSGTFISNDGIRYRPPNGAVFTLNKEQLDPYHIFQNELDQNSLQSLEQNLKRYGVDHNHLVHCHNTLLHQFLNATGETSFYGVNFLTYKGKHGLVLVQHHYERTLHELGNDEVYDRFELTTENGARSIITYTNELSK